MKQHPTQNALNTPPQTNAAAVLNAANKQILLFSRQTFKP
jgi:hypothetical protein